MGVGEAGVDGVIDVVGLVGVDEHPARITLDTSSIAARGLNHFLVSKYKLSPPNIFDLIVSKRFCHPSILRIRDGL